MLYQSLVTKIKKEKKNRESNLDIESLFKDAVKDNKDNKRRISEDRRKYNESVKKSYNLKK